MSNHIRRINYPLVAHNPLSPASSPAKLENIDHVIEAVVLDVIVNESHPEYGEDGYNIGAIKYRGIKNQPFRDESLLSWAFPVETNITEYPLINEIVHIIPSLNRTYYTRKLNTSNRITSHPLVGIATEMNSPVGTTERNAILRNSVSNPIRITTNSPASELGKYFSEQEAVYRLRHDEGDIIYEGRSGQSMRMGSAYLSEPTANFKSTEKNQSANLLFRVGPWKDAPKTRQTRYGLVKEHINEDKSSIWMVEDQIVPLKYATAASAVHKASIDDFPVRLDKNQIIVNTDRFVVNTKSDKILGFSSKGIHWTTSRDFTIDAERDYKSRIDRNAIYTIKGYFDSTAGSRHSLISPKVFVGMRDDEAQPIPAGAILAKFLEDFISAHLQNSSTYVMTSMGPGVLSPSVVAALVQLKADVAKGKYASFNSTVGFVKK